MSDDRGRGTGTLMEERQLFNALIDELLASGKEGQYVLFKGGKVEGFFDTEREAYEVGLDRYGMTPFLVDLVARPTEWRTAPWFQGQHRP